MEVAGLLELASVSQMDSAVANKASYKKFVDAMDSLMDDWYGAGYTKKDIIAYMDNILPDGPNEEGLKEQRATALNEIKSNILQTWKTSDDVLADIEDFFEMIYKDGNYDTMDDMKATFKVLSKLADDYLKEMR